MKKILPFILTAFVAAFIFPSTLWAQSSGHSLRIVSLFQGATDSLVALEVQPVGVVESWSEKPMYKYLRAKLKNVKYVGLEQQPSLEDIALLKPDLIIATRYRHEKIYPMLAKISKTILIPEVYDFKTTLKLVGEAIGKEDLAAEIQSDYDARITEIKYKIQKIHPKKENRKVSLLSIRPDHIRVASKLSFGGMILDEIGFTWTDIVANSSKSYHKLPSYEAIPSIDAHYFFIDVRDKSGVAENYKKWTSHPLWKSTAAYKTSNIYEINSEIWSLGGGIIAANLALDDLEKTLLSSEK